MDSLVPGYPPTGCSRFSALKQAIVCKKSYKGVLGESFNMDSYPHMDLRVPGYSLPALTDMLSAIKNKIDINAFRGGLQGCHGRGKLMEYLEFWNFQEFLDSHSRVKWNMNFFIWALGLFHLKNKRGVDRQKGYNPGGRGAPGN